MNTKPDGFLSTPANVVTKEGTIGYAVPIKKGILVLHPWWGLNNTIKEFCKQLSNEGYLVFAPDLYHGQITDTIEGAEALSANLFKNLDKARSDVVNAAVYLSQHTDLPNTQIAIVGFSMGAFLAFDVSNTLPDRINKVVAYYGTHPGDFQNAAANYLCHFAKNDKFEPQEGIDELLEVLSKASRPVETYQYPGTEHWFAESNRPQYNANAAELAWQRTLSFIKEA